MVDCSTSASICPFSANSRNLILSIPCYHHYPPWKQQDSRYNNFWLIWHCGCMPDCILKSIDLLILLINFIHYLIFFHHFIPWGGPPDTLAPPLSGYDRGAMAACPPPMYAYGNGTESNIGFKVFKNHRQWPPFYSSCIYVVDGAWETVSMKWALYPKNTKQNRDLNFSSWYR